MTSSPHEPADCELAVCDRCDSYGDGYSAGKAAAHFETACGSSGLTPWTAAAGRARRSGKSSVRSCRRQVSRSCFPTDTSRTALALAARRPAGAGGTGAARGPGEAADVRRMALPAQGFAGRPRRWPTSRDMARP